MTASPQTFDSPDAALRALAGRLSVADETELGASCGRVLAADVVADRDSPAADVSAMDGFAVRRSDLTGRPMPIAGECAAGDAEKTLPPGSVLKVFTGGVVPIGADAVVKVEDATERAGRVRLPSEPAVASGMHIRRRGENVAAGSVVVPAGEILTPASMATLANFGAVGSPVHRRVRVAVVTTGGEVVGVDDRPAAHQLRNSNAVSVAAVLESRMWAEVMSTTHVADDPATITATIRRGLASADVIVLTGGVSMGDHDYVPRAVADAGGEVVFHRLPLRPGKPILGAVADGKLILGLPGNPVSATVNARRMAVPLAAKVAGIADWLPPMPAVRLATPVDKPLPLWAMKLARVGGDGRVEWIAGRGSGDLVALGRSDGFIEVPPGGVGTGPMAWWPWNG